MVTTHSLMSCLSKLNHAIFFSTSFCETQIHYAHIYMHHHLPTEMYHMMISMQLTIHPPKYHCPTKMNPMIYAGYYVVRSQLLCIVCHHSRCLLFHTLCTTTMYWPEHHKIITEACLGFAMIRKASWTMNRPSLMCRYPSLYRRIYTLKLKCCVMYSDVLYRLQMHRETHRHRYHRTGVIYGQLCSRPCDHFLICAKLQIALVHDVLWPEHLGLLRVHGIFPVINWFINIIYRECCLANGIPVLALVVEHECLPVGETVLGNVEVMTAYWQQFRILIGSAAQKNN